MSLLPSVDRVEKEVVKTRLWIYGGTMTGKTTFGDKYPKPLMLNTDGNTDFVTAPSILIKDQVEITGRLRKITLGWDYFKNVIAELEEGNNEFETIVIDLVEDLYEMCRQYVYDREGIKHESDKPFKAWDLVTNEYLNTMQRLLNMDYPHMLLISHEDLTRDITKASGDNVTQIKPNLRDKVAIKLVGMVHAVGRVVVEDGARRLEFKTDEVTFGGSRIPNTPDEIKLEFEEFTKLYNNKEER